MDIKRRGMLVGLGGLTAASVVAAAEAVPAHADPRHGPRPPHPGSSASHVVTVKDYGARGDGTGDDYQAFQAMADDTRFPGQSHCVVIPPGHYPISQPIIAKYPLAVTGLAGDGSNWGHASVRLEATATMDALIVPGNWNANTGNGPKISTSNVHLDGGNKAKHGIILGASGETHFNTKVTSTTSHGWFLPHYCRDGSTELKATHGCRFVYCGSGQTGGCGFFAETGRMDSQIVGFVAVHVGGPWGIQIHHGTGWLVDGCHPSQFQKGGIFVDNVWETRIVNNYVDTLGAAQNFDGTCIGIWARGRGPVNITSNVVNQLPSRAPTNKTIGYLIGGRTDDSVLQVNMVSNAGLHHPDSDWTFIDGGHGKVSLTSTVAQNMDAVTGQLDGVGFDDVQQGQTRRGYEKVHVDSGGHLRISHHLGVTPMYADVKAEAKHEDLLVRVSHSQTNATSIDATVRTVDGEPVSDEDIHVYWTATS